MTLDFGIIFHMDAKSLLSWSAGTMVDKIRNLSLATSALWPASKKNPICLTYTCVLFPEKLKLKRRFLKVVKHC